MTALVAVAWCLRCDWRAEGPKADAAAKKHTDVDPKHPTYSSSRPEAK